MIADIETENTHQEQSYFQGYSRGGGNFQPKETVCQIGEF